MIKQLNSPNYFYASQIESAFGDGSSQARQVTIAYILLYFSGLVSHMVSLECTGSALYKGPIY